MVKTDSNLAVLEPPVVENMVPSIQSDLKTVLFRATGLPPGLLMNNPKNQIVRESAPSRGKKITIEDEAKIAAYLNPDGTLYVPVLWFRKSMILSASGKKIKNRSFGTILQNGGTFMVEEIVPLVDPDTQEPLTFKDCEIDTRPVVINKAKVLKARPKITRWQADFHLLVDQIMVPVQNVLDQLGEAGMRWGVGDYRVSKGGPFGRFTVSVVNIS